jgi:hypothetical protein
LGHGSIQTTERYLGVEQDLTNAPCDHLGLRLASVRLLWTTTKPVRSLAIAFCPSLRTFSFASFENFAYAFDLRFLLQLSKREADFTSLSKAPSLIKRFILCVLGGDETQ